MTADLVDSLHGEVALTFQSGSTEMVLERLATGWNMKVFVVMILVLLAAASAVAYSRADMAAGMASVVAHTTQADEPIWLLLSGSALIGLAGALRRSTF